MNLSTETFLAAIRDDGDALRAACLAAPDARVAACPDWDNTGLLAHMGDVYNFMAAQVAADGTDMVGGAQRGDADATGWFDQGFAAVVAALEAADPGAPAWTWATDKTKRFYFRRLANETAVHRWDAQVATAAHNADAPDPEQIDTDIATDGIDEVIEVGMQNTMGGPNEDFPEGSFHLHRTDGEGEWMLSTVDGKLVVTHEHGKGDAALRGAASDLYLFLWERDTGNYDLFGDEAVARAWQAVAP